MSGFLRNTTPPTNKPGNPMPYTRYVTEQQPVMTREYPGRTAAQVATELSYSWQNMTPEARQQYGDAGSRRTEPPPKKRQKAKPPQTPPTQPNERQPDPQPEVQQPGQLDTQDDPNAGLIVGDVRRDDEAVKKWNAEMALSLRMLWRLGTFDTYGYMGYPIVRPHT